MNSARSHDMAQTFVDSVWLSIDELCVLAFVSLPLTLSNFIFGESKQKRNGVVAI